MVAEAERSMGQVDSQAIDDAADAAMLLSGLALESQDQPSLLDSDEESDDDDLDQIPAPPPVNERRPSKRKRNGSQGPLSQGDGSNRSSSIRRRVDIPDEPAAPGFSNPTANTRGLPLSEDEPAFPNPSQNHQQRRNSKRLNARKGKASWVHSKRRALYRKAAKIASDITAASLPHSSQGYVGPTGSSEDAGAIQLEADGAPSEPFYGPLPSNVDPSSHPRLLNLARQGYRLIERSTGPSVFLDKESRVVGWRTGITGGAENEKSWQEENDRLTSAMEDLAEKMARRKRSRPGVSRGEHSSADWGYSYGGGQQQPADRQQTKRERLWWNEFLTNSDYISTTELLQDSWKTWAPAIYEDYLQCHLDILSHNPGLDLVYPPDSASVLPFASVTANLGPKTVCKRHRDCKNKAAGTCAIKVLGPHNSRLGGHIVLHELGLIVEMHPGDVIFFPSAVISHETIPIGALERRYSLVWYSAGGLFRWRDAGFKSLLSWEEQDPVAYGQHQLQGESRWAAGWKNFPTLFDLVSQAGQPQPSST